MDQFMITKEILGGEIQQNATKRNWYHIIHQFCERKEDLIAGTCDMESLNRTIMNWKPMERRLRIQHRKMWLDDVKEDLDQF